MTTLANQAILNTRSALRQRFRSVVTHSHTYSGISHHGGSVAAPESYHRLIAWARHHQIDAVAMGSPYGPVSANLFRQFDGQNRDTYYAPAFDKGVVLAKELAEALEAVREINHLSGGDPHFFLDNETPKARFGHMWWIGHKPQFPAWHDYDQPYDQWMTQSHEALGDGDENIPCDRRPYISIVAQQRRAGALGFWAHPTSWWTGSENRFISNIASEAPAHAFAEGFLDGLVVVGYHPDRPEYQALWFALLDRGVRVPAVAEMDMSLSDAHLDGMTVAMLSYVPSPAMAGEQDSGKPTLVQIRDGFAAGRVVAGCRALVDLNVDGVSIGGVVRSSRERTHRVVLDIDSGVPGSPAPRVELVGRGGRAIWSAVNLPSGRYEVAIAGTDSRDFVVARVWGDRTGFVPRKTRDYPFAISSAVYLHGPGISFLRPMQTLLQLTVAEHSPWWNGRVLFENSLGELIDSYHATSGTIRVALPATARWTLVSADGQRTQTSYLINENTKLRSLQQYLYRGKFRRDFPSAQSGDVPVPAWRLDEYSTALESLSVTV